MLTTVESAFDAFWSANTGNCQKSSYKYCKMAFINGWLACEDVEETPVNDSHEEQRAEDWLREKFNVKTKWKADELYASGIVEAKLVRDDVFNALMRMKERGEVYSYAEFTEAGVKYFVWAKNDKYVKQEAHKN